MEENTPKETEKPTPTECPWCGTELIMNGPGWGFCDNCTAEITYEEGE